MDESEFRKLQNTVQDAILLAYPNPERKGCPGTEVIQRLAEETAIRVVDPAEIDAESTEHIFHCSPCYREYLELRKKAKESR
jgi:hypothetical protein